jgi:CheY-like chemotaxis protein
MIIRENILILDDESVWRGIYENSIRKLGISSIQTVSSLAEAKRAIDAMKFAVAIIDIGLDTSDETNVEGLLAMDKIRSLGDDTSIIVITGRSGPDVIDVVSESIQKHGAVATFAKGKVDSGLLRNAVTDGLRVYREKEADQDVSVHEVLRHQENQMVWDHMMMRVLGINEGVAVFYGFLERLLRAYLPLVSRDNDKAIGVDLDDGVVHGAFWSRAIGSAVVVSLGQQFAVERAMETVASDGSLHGRYRVGEILSEYSKGKSKGVVYALLNYAQLQSNGVE